MRVDRIYNVWLNLVWHYQIHFVNVQTKIKFFSIKEHRTKTDEHCIDTNLISEESADLKTIQCNSYK